MKRHLLIISALSIVLLSCTRADFSRGRMNELVNAAVEQSLTTLLESAAQVRDSLCFPTYGKPVINADSTSTVLRWKTKTSADWVSGFYGGCQWYGFALSGDPQYEALARKWTYGIEKEKHNAHTHDLGFRFMCTFGNGMRLSSDKDFVAYCQSVRDTAALTLSHRYHPEFGALSSDWDKEPIEGTTPCVIDIMMNLEILFEAALSMNDSTLYDIAVSHANTTWRDFVRQDGGTYHVVRYDSTTGAVVDRGQLQGDTKESTWSRGHAWLVYGMVVTYRYTREEKYLDYAMQAADYFVANLNEDGIAPWDFQSEDKQTDVSASAIVTSSLYELLSYLPQGEKKAYWSEKADMMLAALCAEPYFCADGGDCILDHSVQYYHQGHNVDKPAIFADYYFLEALYRYRTLYNL